MPSYIYDCGSFQDIRSGILVFWAFDRGYCRGVGRVLGYGLALRHLSSGVGGNNNNNKNIKIKRDSFRFGICAARICAR
jgi:hypothetical protein